jgi:hypothetical protein
MDVVKLKASRLHNHLFHFWVDYWKNANIYNRMCTRIAMATVYTNKNLETLKLINCSIVAQYYTEVKTDKLNLHGSMLVNLTNVMLSPKKKVIVYIQYDV